MDEKLPTMKDVIDPDNKNKKRMKSIINSIKN